MFKKVLYNLSLLLFAFSIASSYAQVGITSVPFLQIEPDSRGAGMGNTGVAIADNASAVYWNAAGLAYQKGNQISVTHAEWLPAFNADLFYDYLVGKYYIEGIGTIGAHITYLNLGEQIRTNEQGLEQGRFNSNEFAGGISYGGKLSENFALGGGVRFIYSSLAEGQVGQQTINPGSSVAVDLSGLYRSKFFNFAGSDAQFSAGFNLSNVGPGIQYTDNAQKDPLPTVLRMGWAFEWNLDPEGINTITIANDISKIMARGDSTGSEGVVQALFSSWDEYTRYNGSENVTLGVMDQFMIGTGIEYWYNDLFAIRGGYYYEHPENGDRVFFTVGAGLRYSLIGVDFSYIAALEEEHPLANTTRFSLLINF
ncbi:type IX secretion system outer membrane channel protein PorV [Aliifodinibius sp. S!AR15-10]|uniref:type IX secretion system outer membrane channel protein PorV n=1 Tax=Aliifodinibius sp. S!AR15-10 TaxID=2950437 RepID=UPI002863C970|nr:type IX secretion system outer membrane channel protein PorV [Aliifodinibius sp. S!AR15-10]MDR8392155.1 type IX secretion system outer membrane channel protein PorV [Aliifodinibius sp. S!AR15-10]